MTIRGLFETLELAGLTDTAADLENLLETTVGLIHDQAQEYEQDPLGNYNHPENVLTYRVARLLRRRAERIERFLDNRATR